ncbi:AraC family transcriptional regulator [Ereboglobus luteus]|uniref:HTH araC/xylS-type domain-containing protein n=1 Tax=Ereboglobus luteus TaxID=1796921 RepID=A0A2U8E5E1_9BACT|nr:AraC family transcriptional regulator [Ereboglobus luteus]AWI10073.1 hypothetical protein CKA38_13130 [Ereboglobus luteus]
MTPDLKKMIALLPSPKHPLRGRRTVPLNLPENIICFGRRAASALNQPQRGRALHRRFVLMLALQTGVTVRVDDREITLNEGEGLMVFPFQFHDYTNPGDETLQWLFITFDLVDDGTMQALRYQPFAISPAMRSLATELVAAYLKTGPAANDLITLQLSLLLAHIRQTKPASQRRAKPTLAPGLFTKVNEIVEDKAQPPNVKVMASTLGISVSHLRARFRESCGVSLGKHLRRLRLEKARGLLRLSTRRVTEIAEMCGFSSVYTFSRAFHTAYGVAPLNYRKGGHVKLQTNQRRKK